MKRLRLLEDEQRNATAPNRTTRGTRAKPREHGYASAHREQDSSETITISYWFATFSWSTQLTPMYCPLATELSSAFAINLVSTNDRFWPKADCRYGSAHEIVAHMASRA